MRVILNDEWRNWYFSSLKTKANLSWREIANLLEVNGRMLRSWRSGKFTIPKDLCDKVENFYGIKMSENARMADNFWHIKEAAKKGALARYDKYGNLGTPEGRRKGGLNSLKSLKLKGTNFKFRKKIKQPRKSKELAEMIGILIGDGGISRFQTKVTLSLETDNDYAILVQSNFEKLFGVSASILETRRDSTIEVVVSSRALVEFLMSCGLPIGNKIKQGLDIPVWIKENLEWSRSCLRGIFDTDGSIYLDRHSSKNGFYKSVNVAFTSASVSLRNSISQLLRLDGFTPTVTSEKSIRLRRKEEVTRFFEIIGSNNPKHLEKFIKFLQEEEYPSGHTGTVSKTVGVARPT